jgi:hypothetical protein
MLLKRRQQFISQLGLNGYNINHSNKKKRVLFKSILVEIEIAYNNNETKPFYQEVNSIKMVKTTNIND